MVGGFCVGCGIELPGLFRTPAALLIAAAIQGWGIHDEQLLKIACPTCETIEWVRWHVVDVLGIRMPQVPTALTMTPDLLNALARRITDIAPQLADDCHAPPVSPESAAD